MEEARASTDERQSIVLQRTPLEVLEELQRGNTRFWTGRAQRPERSAFERRGLISKQFPSVAVLGCSDSRVPTEIVFDQGLGDLFVIRVAGNCLDIASMASVQYAVHHLKVKVLMVLGHELCGAVKAAMLPLERVQQEPPQLEQALVNIKLGLDEARLSGIQDSRAQDREAVLSNVVQQMERLKRNTGIMGKVNASELILVGAFYEISSGIVDFHKIVAQEPEVEITAGAETMATPAPAGEMPAKAETVKILAKEVSPDEEPETSTPSAELVKPVLSEEHRESVSAASQEQLSSSRTGQCATTVQDLPHDGDESHAAGHSLMAPPMLEMTFLETPSGLHGETEDMLNASTDQQNMAMALEEQPDASADMKMYGVGQPSTPEVEHKRKAPFDEDTPLKQVSLVSRGMNAMAKTEIHTKDLPSQEVTSTADHETAVQMSILEPIVSQPVAVPESESPVAEVEASMLSGSADKEPSGDQCDAVQPAHAQPNPVPSIEERWAALSASFSELGRRIGMCDDGSTAAAQDLIAPSAAETEIRLAYKRGESQVARDHCVSHSLDETQRRSWVYGHTDAPLSCEHQHSLEALHVQLDTPPWTGEEKEATSDSSTSQLQTPGEDAGSMSAAPQLGLSRTDSHGASACPESEALRELAHADAGEAGIRVESSPRFDVQTHEAPGLALGHAEQMSTISEVPPTPGMTTRECLSRLSEEALSGELVASRPSSTASGTCPSVSASAAASKARSAVFAQPSHQVAPLRYGSEGTASTAVRAAPARLPSGGGSFVAQMQSGSMQIVQTVNPGAPQVRPQPLHMLPTQTRSDMVQVVAVPAAQTGSGPQSSTVQLVSPTRPVMHSNVRYLGGVHQ